MVNVSHNNYNRCSAYKISLVVLAVIDNLLLDCNNYLFFNLRVELHSDKRSGVKVDCVGRGNHCTHHKRFLYNLGNRSLQAKRELLNRDFVGNFYCNGLLLALKGDSLKSFSLGLALAVTSVLLLLHAVRKFLLFGSVISVGAARLRCSRSQIVIL